MATYNFHEDRLSAGQVVITNTSGVAYEQGQLVLEQGFFGNVTEPDGIAAAATGKIDISTDRIIQTDQINTGDTFAVSASSVEADVWLCTSTGNLADAVGNGGALVGQLVNGGAKDAWDNIQFKPYSEPISVT